MSERALALILLGGAGYAWWRSQGGAAGGGASGTWSSSAGGADYSGTGSAMDAYQAYQAQQPQQQQQQGGAAMGFNLAPVLGWIVDKVTGRDGGTGGGWNTGQGIVGDSWGAESGATATEDGASAGGSAGGDGMVRALQTIIGQAEAPGGYDTVYGGIPADMQPPRPITTMTVGEVRAWQRRIDPYVPSEAAGRYQIMPDTLDWLIAQGVLSPGEPFGVEAQDRASVALMERRGLSRYRSGQLTASEFGQRLSQEWAGLPALTRDRSGRSAQGQSYYAGDGLNRAQVSIQRVLGALTGSGGGGWV